MKSFFASVECSLRGLNPQTTPLVVVDESRGAGAVVLAVSSYLKSLGVKNRCRLYEIPKDIPLIKAKPRMKYYIEYAVRLYEIFLHYVDKSDIHTYSIDESFLYVEPYLKYYNDSPKLLAKSICEEIAKELGVFSTCGAGDNMYLAKVALDIMAKHNGGYYYLDKEKYVRELWHHRPLTDFWQIGSGIEAHLARMGIYDMEGIAMNETRVIKEFGVIGSELYQHAFGNEECKISDIKEYTPESKSISRSQILFSDYKRSDAIIPLLEMLYIICVDLCSSNRDCRSISFFVGYSKEYMGGYGKNINLPYRSRDYGYLANKIKSIYFKEVADLPIRRLMVSANEIDYIHNRQMNLFYKDNENTIEVFKTISSIWDEFGKNSVLLGSSLLEGSTIKIRNKCIGGHNGE